MTKKAKTRDKKQKISDAGKQINFYKIDEAKLEIISNDKRNISFGMKLIALSNYSKKASFNEIILRNKTNEYVSIFYENTEQNNSWKNFFGPLSTNAEVFKEIVDFKPKILSFAVIIKIKNQVYSFSGGYGHNLLNGLTIQRLGLEIITRLLDNENISPTHTGERMLFGSILSAKRFYKKGWNLSYDNSIGKLYSELSTVISEKNLAPIFKNTGVKIDTDATCIASNTFQVRKSITFDQAIKVTQNINNLFKNIKKPIITINGITQLYPTDPKVSDLEMKLFKKLHIAYYNNKDLSDIDIVPDDNVERFVFASTFSVRKSHGKKDIIELEDIKFPNLNLIFNELRKVKDLEINKSKLNQNDFIKQIQKLKFLVHPDDGTPPSRHNLLNIINGEIKDKSNKPHYKLGKSWLELKKQYLDKLNRKCSDIVNETWDDKLLSPYKWKQGEDEFDFIEHFTSKKNYIVGHPIKVENMELFDLVKIDPKSKIIYIIHAKKDFDVKLRDLHQQIVTSAIIIEEDIRTDLKHLKKLYKSMKGRATSKTKYKKKYYNSLRKSCQETLKTYSTEAKFLNLFKNYKRVYCIAFVDHSSVKYTPLSNTISSSGSNIAKQSLVEIRSSIAQITDFGERFKLIQLKW